MMITMSSERAVLRIPRRLIKVETDDYIVVDFGDAERFLQAVMAAIATSDQGKGVVLKVDE